MRSFVSFPKFQRLGKIVIVNFPAALNVGTNGSAIGRIVSRHLARVGALAVTGMLACTSPDRPPAPATVRETRGDTVIVTATQTALPTWRVSPDSVEILWRDDRLGVIRAMTSVGSTMFVGDRSNVHVVDTTGTYLRTIGREGDGPGEFRGIHALTSDTDQLVVLDARIRRATRFDHSGRYVESFSIPFVQGLGSFNEQGLAGTHETGVVAVFEGLIRTDGIPTQRGVIWIGPDDSTQVIGQWDDGLWTDAGPFLMRDEVFGPRAHIAIGPEGRYAVGDGLDYCVHVARIGDDAVQRVCRARNRVPVTNAVRNLDVPTLAARVGINDELQDMLIRKHRVEKLGPLRPSYDQLRFDALGRLWVRVVDDAQRDVHPDYLRYAEIGPSRYRWDVFDPDGQWVGEAYVPRSIDPLVIGVRSIIGRYELASGEHTVGRIAW